MQEGTSTTEYVWTWSDGSVTVGNVTQSHIYSQPGPYTISVAANESGEMLSGGPKSLLVFGNKSTLKLICIL